MKISVLLLLVLFAVQGMQAQTNSFPVEKRTIIAGNLINAVESDNPGLQTSGAKVMTDLISGSYLERSDVSRSLIPLLKILKNGQSDEERMAAAVAIYELGNGIGIYQLRSVALFDNNKKVAAVCKNLYYAYHKQHGTEYFINF